MYLLHCTCRCNILCSKHDIDMRMNEWNRHALFLSWNGRNRYLHSSLLKIWDFFHEWKKSQIFNRDSCKNLLIFHFYIFLPCYLSCMCRWDIVMTTICLSHSDGLIWMVGCASLFNVSSFKTFKCKMITSLNIFTDFLMTLPSVSCNF